MWKIVINAIVMAKMNFLSLFTWNSHVIPNQTWCYFSCGMPRNVWRILYSFYTLYNPLIWAVIILNKSEAYLHALWERTVEYGLKTFPCFSLCFSRSFLSVVSLSHPLFRSTPCCFHFSVPFILSFKILIIFWVISFSF